MRYLTQKYLNNKAEQPFKKGPYPQIRRWWAEPPPQIRRWWAEPPPQIRRS